MVESGTGSDLKRRTERRVRMKLWRSVAVVDMSRLDLVDDPRLPFAFSPWFIVVTQRQHIDMLVRAFVRGANNLAANADVTITVVGVLNGHRHLFARFHVFIFEAPLGGVDENVFIVRAEPNGRHLRRAVGHERGEIKKCF